jgi:hypothetical protein
MIIQGGAGPKLALYLVPYRKIDTVFKYCTVSDMCSVLESHCSSVLALFTCKAVFFCTYCSTNVLVFFLPFLVSVKLLCLLYKLNPFMSLRLPMHNLLMVFSGSCPQLTCRLMPRPVDHPHLSQGINLYEATLTNIRQPLNLI